MSNFGIARMAKVKSGGITRIENHHERLKDEYKSNPDIDKSRTHLNYHLVEPTDTYRKMVNQRIEEVGARKRKDSVLLQDCFVGATPDWIKAKSLDEQKEYFTHAFDFFANRYGRENIISAVVHMDEATPHMHLCFVPITKDGRLSSKELVGGPKGLVKFQDDFHEHMTEKYPDLTRGISKRITHRKHVPAYAYKQVGGVYEHYDEIVQAVNNIGLVANAKKKEEALELLGRYIPEFAAIKVMALPSQEYLKELEDKIEEKDKVIASKNATISEKNREISGWQSRTADAEKEVDRKDYHLDVVRAKYWKLKEVIDRIPTSVLKQIAPEYAAREREEWSR